jgi:hypothetical protein
MTSNFPSQTDYLCSPFNSASVILNSLSCSLLPTLMVPQIARLPLTGLGSVGQILVVINGGIHGISATSSVFARLIAVRGHQRRQMRSVAVSAVHRIPGGSFVDRVTRPRCEDVHGNGAAGVRSTLTALCGIDVRRNGAAGVRTTLATLCGIDRRRSR